MKLSALVLYIETSIFQSRFATFTHLDFVDPSVTVPVTVASIISFLGFICFNSFNSFIVMVYLWFCFEVLPATYLPTCYHRDPHDL